MELSKLQTDILNAKEPVIFVNAAAAARKSRLLTEKVKQSVEAGKKVVAFTFTNMAASEIKTRIGIENNPNLYIGTIHAYCLYLLLKNGVEEAKTLVEDEKFDTLFKLIKKNPHCIEDLDVCLCDETQDSNKLQLNFIFDVIHSREYFIVYDLRQSIYQWCGAEPKLLMSYSKKLDAKIYSLNENYRNAPEILNFAKDIIYRTGLYDDSIPMREKRGLVREKYFSYEELLNIIKNTKEFKKWAVLARSNADVDNICHYLKKHNIPCDTFKQGDLKKEELVERMKANTVKVLTIHSAKGLEWDYVAVIGAKTWSDEECNVAYVAATRARDGLLWFKPAPKRRIYTKNWE